MTEEEIAALEAEVLLWRDRVTAEKARANRAAADKVKARQSEVRAGVLRTEIASLKADFDVFKKRADDAEKDKP